MCYNINRIGEVMNKRAFTLVELLVVIVIMGLISYMGFPSLMRVITDTNAKKEFEYYGNSMIDAAKVHLKKEITDLKEAGFFKTEDKVVEFQLKDLIQDEYITQFVGSKKQITCSTDSGKVRIKYKDNKYIFDYQLICNYNNKTYTKNYDDEEFITS